MDYTSFVELCGPQLYGSRVPESLWPRVHQKVTQQTFDVHECFQLAAIEDENSSVECWGYATVATRAVPAKSDVWLIDHMWTFRARSAERELMGNKALQHRILYGPGGAPPSSPSGEEKVEVAAIMNKVWRKAESYRIATEHQLDEESCWYLLDEVGTGVQIALDEEEEEVNVCLAPFFDPVSSIAFTVMWPVALLDEGDVAVSSHLSRGAKACPLIAEFLWGDTDAAAQEAACLNSEDEEVKKPLTTHTSRSPSGAEVSNNVLNLKENSPLSVWTDLELLREYLTDSTNFVFVDDVASADILWLSDYVADLAERYPMRSAAFFVSQFPHEFDFCNKAGMADTMYRAFGTRTIPWLPLTFNAKTQLHGFLGEFLRRKQQSETSNLWITKPHSMARSMDMVVTENIVLLLRLAETGPKVIAEYIARPCLFRGRKFDMRFVVLVRSFEPLEIFLYDVFWLRFAAEPYGLDDFDVYEKHFTVMNYANPAKLLQIHHDAFVREFDESHGRNAWDGCLTKIRLLTRDVFSAISAVHFAAGHRQGGGGEDCIRARATYGLDVMLAADLSPRLLEITYSPDCGRACKYHPHFFNDVFKTLFLGQPTHCSRL